MSDLGPATGSGELYLQTGTSTGVFLEIHTQNNVVSAASSGVPGGLAGPSSAENNFAPADFVYSSPTGYGLSYTTSFAAIANFGGTSPSFGPANPSGAGNLNLFRMKNPA